MEFYDKTGLAIAQLRWSSILVAKEIIPQQNLRPGEVLPTPTATATATSTNTSTPTNTATPTPEICSPNGTGISGSYYTYSAATNSPPTWNGSAWSSTTILRLSRIDPVIDFNWSNGSIEGVATR